MKMRAANPGMGRLKHTKQIKTLSCGDTNDKTLKYKGISILCTSQHFTTPFSTKDH